MPKKYNNKFTQKLAALFHQCTVSDWNQRNFSSSILSLYCCSRCENWRKLLTVLVNKTHILVV